MKLTLIVLVTLFGVIATVYSAVRIWLEVKGDARRQLIFGYFALMVVAAAVSSTVLRLL